MSDSQELLIIVFTDAMQLAWLTRIAGWLVGLFLDPPSPGMVDSCEALTFVFLQAAWLAWSTRKTVGLA